MHPTRRVVLSTSTMFRSTLRLRSHTRGLQSRIAGIHSTAARQKAARWGPGIALATTGLGISVGVSLCVSALLTSLQLYLLDPRNNILLDSQRSVDKAQAEDPDAAPPGAKGSKNAGVVSNKKEHAKFQKKGREGYIPMKEVGQHDLAVSRAELARMMSYLAQHDAWVIIDGEVWDVTQFLKSHVSMSTCRRI